MKTLKRYTDILSLHLKSVIPSSDKHILFDPINYILSKGGKRIRPALCLMACESFGGDVSDSIPAALSVELFHNFSLLHDDIMDNAPLRRGEETVHNKWNTNQAILSGDALFAIATQSLEKSNEDVLLELLKVYNKTALDVCIGQQYDMEFETRKEVSISEYIEMIRLKTSVLLGCSLKMGAICSNAKKDDLDAIFKFGVNLGIAFQLKDDYLDAFASGSDFGKQVGGDILADKKTYLYIKTLEKGDSDDVQTLRDLEGERHPNKVETILNLYKKLQVQKDLEETMLFYSNLSLENLEKCDMNPKFKEAFRLLVFELMQRNV